MDMEEKGESEEARSLFLRAWNEATNDFEKFIAAYYVARCQETLTEKLKWLETALRLAEQIDDESVRPAFSSLYSEIAQCQEELGDHECAKREP